MVLVVSGLVSLGCLLLGYGLGNRQVVSDAIERAELNGELQALQARFAQLEAELIDSRLNEQVQRDATAALRQDLTQAHQKMTGLQEEVTFFKGLMAPSSLRKGLQVAELELTPMDSPEQGETAYRYQLLLTQVALRRSFIAGEITMDVVGRYSQDAADVVGKESVLSLTELSDMKVYPLKFRFRYFQDLAGRLTLPEGFKPTRVEVTANQNGKEPQQVTFPWPVSEAQTEIRRVASSG